MAPVLGYWRIRAIAEPIRYMLHYLEIDFEDRRIDNETWDRTKYKLDLDFPNLPYYIDGDIKITQSLAICRHLARKHGLYGETDSELIRTSQLEQVIDDMRWVLIRLTFNPNFEKLKGDLIKKLPEQFKAIDNFVGDGPWVAGQKLTYVDFLLYEMLDQHLYLSPDCLEGLENLISFRKRFRELTNVKKYLESDKFVRWGLFAVTAYFGARGSSPLPPPVI